MDLIDEAYVKTLLDKMASIKVKLDNITLDGNIRYEEFAIDKRHEVGEYYRFLGETFYELTMYGELEDLLK